MTKKVKSSLKNKLMNIALLLPTVAGMAANLYSSVKFEVAAIRNRLILLFILAVLCCILLTSAWMCVNALLIIYILSTGMSLTFSIAMALFFNLFILMATCLAMAVFKMDASMLKQSHQPTNK